MEHLKAHLGCLLPGTCHPHVQQQGLGDGQLRQQVAPAVGPGRCMRESKAWSPESQRAYAREQRPEDAESQGCMLHTPTT